MKLVAHNHQENRPPEYRSDSPFPDEKAVGSAIGDLGLHINLRALNHAHPSEIALVAACFREVGHQLDQFNNSN